MLDGGDDTDEDADVVLPLRPPETIDRDIKQLKRIVRDGTPTIILCDNEGQAERLDELLADDERRPSPAALSIGVLDGGFVVPHALRILTDHEIFRRERRIRRARRYATATTLDTLSLKPGDFVVHLEHGVGIYRGIETIFVGQSTIEVAVVEYEGGDRLNVPLYRIDQIERYRSSDDVSDGFAAAAAASPRRATLGAAAREGARRDSGDDRRAARSLRAPQDRHASGRTCPTRRGSGSSSRRSCSRTRPTSARRPFK